MDVCLFVCFYHLHSTDSTNNVSYASPQLAPSPHSSPLLTLSQIFSPLSQMCSVLISVTLSWGMGVEEEEEGEYRNESQQMIAE